MGRRSRKRTSPSPEPAQPPARRRPIAPKPPSRSERRNAQARAALEPLQEGERPRAVTVGAVVAALLALGNLIAYAAGLEVDGQRPPFLQVAIFAGLMLVAAAGMWRAKYWAVLGFQAILAILVILFAVLLTVASNLWAVVVSVAVIGLAGTLFWFLIRSMARIQMPRR